MPAILKRVKTFYLVTPNVLIERMFILRGWKKSSISFADAAIFPGGEDVTPAYYADETHPTTRMNSERDQREASQYHICDKDQLKIGICRGAQFLNVMAGGKLWQNVDNHAILGTHPITYRMPSKDLNSIRVVNVTSTHHQMMRPSVAGEVWGHAGRLATFRDTGKTTNLPSAANDGPDPEIVFYEKSRVLCFQPHPEFVEYEPCRDLFFECIDRAYSAIVKLN